LHALARLGSKSGAIRPETWGKARLAQLRSFATRAASLLDFSITMGCFVQSWVPVLGLLISAGTLAVVIIYTRITARLERAAQEQAEASQKPVLVLQFITREEGLEQALEQKQRQIAPQAMKLAESSGGEFVIRNIGSGPALNVTYVIHPASLEPDVRDSYSRHRFLPYLGSGDSMPGPITIAAMGLDVHKFAASYDSLSGKHYRTEMQISGGLLCEKWIFQRTATRKS